MIFPHNRKSVGTKVHKLNALPAEKIEMEETEILFGIQVN